MKKLFLMLALIAAMFAAGAQTDTVFYEGFNAGTLPTGWTSVDADGDGYNWDADMFDSVIASASFVNNVGALTPDNWLITPAITLTSNSALTFYAKGQDASWAAEYFSVYVATGDSVAAFLATTPVLSATTTGDFLMYSVNLSAYTGQTVRIAFRHYNVTDMYWLDLDDVLVYQLPTTPILAITPETIDFDPLLLGDSATVAVAVTGYNLTSGVSVTSALPFLVSSDNAVFATTATLPATGGTLYVRYAPTAGGANTGSVQLASTGVTSVTLSVSGYCIDCSNPVAIPLVEDFEDNSTTLSCWNVVSANANTGIIANSAYSYSGSNFFAFAYDTIVPQYLISPELTGTGNGVEVEFMYRAYSSGYPESFAVGYSTTTNDVAAFTWGTELTNITNTTYQQYSDFFSTPNVKYIAVKCTSYDKYFLFVDSLVVKEAPNCIPPTGLTADNITTNSATLTWTGDAGSYSILNMSNGSVVATQAGTSYAITGLQPMTQYTYGVVAQCAGSNSDTITVTFSTACAAISLPYTETFEATSSAVECWTSEGAGAWTISTGDYSASTGAFEGDLNAKIIHSSNGNATKLVSPVFDNVDNGLLLHFAYVMRSWYGDLDELRVYARAAADSAWQQVAEYTAAAETWTVTSVSIPGTVYQIAFEMTDNYGYGVGIDSVVFTPLTADYCFPVTNLTADSVTAHSATLTWTGDANTYTVVNMANGAVLTTQAGTSYNLTGLTSATPHTYGVVANCTSGNSDTVTVNFTTQISCQAPTGLVATLTPGNGTVATLSWTENGSATSWQICLNGDTTNYITASDSTVYNLTGLTAEQSYTAKVRAFCDVDDQSAWTATITFTPTNAYSVTVNDGATTNNYVPIYGLYVDEITKSQFIIPAADLAAMEFGTISKLTFYAIQANVDWDTATFNVYMTETSETTVSALADYSSMTQVYAGTLSISGNKMEVTFNTPYTYMGGNLMIGFLQTHEGTYHSTYWQGVQAAGASMGGYGASVSQRNFLPKTTIYYTPGTAPSCMPVANLAVSNLTDVQATLTWNGTAASYNIYNGTTFVANTTSTTYTVTGLTANTDYVFGVRAVCSATDSSILKTVNVVTGCASAAINLPFTETFNANSATRDCWTTYNSHGDVLGWTTSLQGTEMEMMLSFSYDFTTETPVTPNNWLISPKLHSNAGSNVTMQWSVSAGDDEFFAEHYGVYVSTTTTDTASFTLLNEWTLTSAAEAIQVLDLSAYAGQDIYVAFRHFNCNDEFVLIIDNVELYEGSYVPDTLTVVFAVNNPIMGTTVPVPGTYQYLMGDTVMFHPEANTGYHFTNWVMSVGSESDTLDASFVSTGFIVNSTFMSYGAITFTALFESDGTPITDSLTINLSINNPALGTIDPLPGIYHVALNDSLVLSATPNAGVNFDGWKMMIGGQTLATVPINPFTLPVNENNITFGEVTIVAMFNDGTSAPDSITVIVNTADATMGTTNPAPGTYHYAVGSESFLAALPNPGYHNLYWIEEFAIAGMVEYDTLYADTVYLTVVPMMAGVTLSITAYFEANADEPCDVPTNLHASAFDAHSITIGWNTNGNATSWNIHYRVEGGEWSNASATTNTYVINGLEAETLYEIEVQADCGNGNLSDWSEPIHISTAYDGIENRLESNVSLYPNPAREYVDIRVDGDVNVKMMEVYDVYGKLINTVVVTENPTRINVSSLADGLYFVRVSTEAGMVTKTFVKR